MPSHSHDVLARLAPEVPAAMVERATRWTPDSVPSVAAPAASVILLRDGSVGLETYLLHRHARMAFAPSADATAATRARMAVGRYVYDKVASSGELHVIDDFFHELRRHG